MKTFSIAVGRYTLATEAAASLTGSRISGTGAARDISDVEAEADVEARKKLADRLAGAGAGAGAGTGTGGEEPEAETEEEMPVVAPITAGGGDVLEFGVDPDDYSICVLTVHRADGSRDWIRFQRNAAAVAEGSEPVTGANEGIEAGLAG